MYWLLLAKKQTIKERAIMRPTRDRQFSSFSEIYSFICYSMIRDQLKKAWIVVLTTFPPRACGIATFSNDLCQAFDKHFAPELETKIVAINCSVSSNLVYSDKVIDQIQQNNRADYEALADTLNTSPQVKLVSIQHEFGLYGGLHGDLLLDFTKALRKPLVITFHTVLPDPDKHLCELVQTLATHAHRIVVMTHASRTILETIYGVATEKIVVIPHGIHPVSFEPSNKAKKNLHLSQEKTLFSTFGLLSKGKGIEHVLEALPAVITKHPDIHYLIIGATHPVVLREEGESYRQFLMQRITKLGLEHHVSFENQFLPTEELLQYLHATDIYLATPLNPNQAVSGTLSYALGIGRPVIATAFAQAKEIITPEVGILVDFQRPEQITEAMLQLLSDKHKQVSLGKTAYFRTRAMTWPNVAIAHMETFKKFTPSLYSYEKHAPEIKLDHLIRLTDDFGIIQFAKLAEPDPNSGYTVDDNARALIVAVRHYRQYKRATSLTIAHTYLKFLHSAQRTDGKFENYAGPDRKFVHEKDRQENLDDANGRALYALSVAATSPDMSNEIRKTAQRMYEQSFSVADDFTSPRAKAFFIKSLALQMHSHPNETYREKLIKNCNFLVQQYKASSTNQWQWFEPILTYSNALLSEAVLLGYSMTHDQAYFDIGKKTLDFLIATTFENTMYIPIGQRGWFQRGGQRHIFDQQPEDTASMIEALKTMYEISQITQYQELGKRAFHWFLGENLLGQVIYDQVTGGCYDGVGEHEVNLNEGAESTLSYLSSRLLIS